MTNEDQAGENLPSVLLEAMQKRQGIIVLSGSLQSGLPQTLEKSLRTTSNRQVVRFQAGKPFDANAEVLVADGSVDNQSLAKLIEASEEGRLVVMAQFASSSLAVLRRFLSLEFGEGRRHLVSRLADQLILMASQMKVRTLTEGQFEDVREIVLMTPTMRSFVRNEDLQSAEELINSGEETSGTVSFNQNLLQFLLRRKIDIKSAFEVSRDPAHLDRILKKVGI